MKSEGGVIARPQAVSPWLGATIALATVIGFTLTLFGTAGTADAVNKIAVFAVMPVAGGLCLLFIPFVQRRLFKTGWSDGLSLPDTEGCTQTLAETEAVETKESLNLTLREQEVLTGLLEGIAPKEIAYTLKISYPTVNFHITNLYRKLEIHSRAELFAKYK
jgi:DNA-binding CsgD family transcriptional regulator